MYTSFTYLVKEVILTDIKAEDLNKARESSLHVKGARLYNLLPKGLSIDGHAGNDHGHLQDQPGQLAVPSIRPAYYYWDTDSCSNKTQVVMNH
jgi:hypothetical protein